MISQIIPDVFHDITLFVLLHSDCQLVQGNLNLALDVMNNISKSLPAILLHFMRLKLMLLNDRKRQPVMKFLPLNEILYFGEFCLFILKLNMLFWWFYI